MRRLVILLVLALIGATAFGLTGVSSGVSVNGTSISNAALRSELSVVAATPIVQCYLEGLGAVNYAKGGGGSSIVETGAAAWTNLRIEGVAIDEYVTSHFKFHATAADLATAKSSLEGELTQAATTESLTCPGTSTQALAAMSSSMRNALIEGQAASLYLVSKLNSTIPLTVASMKAYYASHTSSYDTLCISLALVPTTQVTAFAKAQAAGASVATLAKSYSVDASGAKGGAYGCYSPTSTEYSSVRNDVGTTKLNTFPTTPSYITSNGTEYALYVAATSRTTTPYAKAAAAVLSDIESANASAANVVKENILYEAAIAVDPAFGRWGLNTSGPGVFVSAVPSTSDVNAATVLTTANATPYT